MQAKHGIWAIMINHSYVKYCPMLKKWPKVKLYTGTMRRRVILENFVQSKRAGKAYYLYNGIATYIGSRKGLKETE